MMDAKATRVRWNATELLQLAQEMARLQREDTGLSDLGAVRQAQGVLTRQRDIKTWPDVAERLQPYLDAERSAGSSHAAAPATPSPEGVRMPVAEITPPVPEHTAEEGASAEAAAGTPALEPGFALNPPMGAAVDPVRDIAGDTTHTQDQPGPLTPLERRQQHLAAERGLDTLATEAALLAALQSPVVEAALVDLFSRSLAKALSKVSVAEEAASRAPEPIEGTLRRVLLAGFPAPQSKSIEDALGKLCEVRVWRPNQGPQLFETLARICSIAVIPEEAEDEVDEALRAHDLKVIRHNGNPARLAERLVTVA